MEQETFDVADFSFEDPTTETPEQKQEPKEVVEEKKEVKEEPKQESTQRTTQQPQRFEGESDTQYGLRLQLFTAGLAKADASEEEKSLITEQMKSIRKQLSSGKPTETTKTETQSGTIESEEEKKVIAENLRNLGYLNQDEVKKLLDEALGKVTQKQDAVLYEQRYKEQTEGIKEFYNRRPDIASSKESRSQLEQIVMDKFKITPDSTKDEILLAMEMVANFAFPRTDRSAVARETQEKIDVMNISGGNRNSGQSYEVESDTIKTLKDAGWSDQDIKAFTS
jgi:hypothetical protein